MKAKRGQNRRTKARCATAALGGLRADPVPRVSLGRYDLTREEIWVNLIHRDRLHGLKEPARDPGGVSVGMALPDDLDADRHAFDR